jgi:hypothetical protein
MLLSIRRFSSSFRGLAEVVADKGLFCALDTDRGQAWREILHEEPRIGEATTVEGSGSACRSRHSRCARRRTRQGARSRISRRLP